MALGKILKSHKVLLKELLNNNECRCPKAHVKLHPAKK